MPARPAAGGGRWVEVDPARLPRWLDNFAQRHGGPPEVVVRPYGLRLSTPDGSVARLHAPPGTPGMPGARGTPGARGSTGHPPSDPASFTAAARAAGPVGLLLVRRGGYAVGVADGADLRSSKVDSSYVQSRTAAGGWSQQRFARRRENQARALAGSAANVAARVLLPEAGRLAALVCGGDRPLVDAVLADRRLAPLLALRAERFLDVPDPRLAVLTAAVGRARAVHILLTDPPGGAPER